MPITGKFVADFSEFNKGVADAEGKLLKFEKTSKSAGKAGDEFGYQLVQAQTKSNTFGNEIGKVDSILRVLGVNLGPLGGAITEVTGILGTLGTTMGVVSGAAALLAVGIGSYKLTRAFGELTGGVKENDKAMQDWWQRILGIQTGVEEAAAKQDVLARATANAKRQITDYSEAIEINRKATEAQGRAWQQSVNPARESRQAISEWQKEIRDIRKEGNIEALNKDLQSQNFSLQTLATRYGTTVDALQYYKRQLEETSAAEKKAAEDRKVALEKQAADLRKMYNDVGLLEIKAAEDHAKALEKQQADDRAYYNWVGERRMEDDAAALKAATDRAVAEANAGQVAMEAAIAEPDARVAATQAKQEHTAAVQEMAQAIDNAAQISRALAGNSSWAGGSGGTLGGGVGIPQGSGVLSDMERIFMRTGSLAAWRGRDSLGASGTTVVVNGSVLGTPDQIARVVGDAMSANYRGGGHRWPA